MLSFVWRSNLYVFGIVLLINLCLQCLSCNESTIATPTLNISSQIENSTVETITKVANFSELPTSSESLLGSIDAVENVTRLYPKNRVGEGEARFFISSSSNLIGNHQIPPINRLSIDKTDDKLEYGDKGDDKKDDPLTPLYGIYSDCLFRMSIQCVQRKLLIFIDRISKLRSVSIISDMLSVVRSKNDYVPIVNEDGLEARLSSSNDPFTKVSKLLTINVERFFRNHVFRIYLPPGITASVESDNKSSNANYSTRDTIELNISRALDDDESSSRGKQKKLKKYLGYLLQGKMALMGPLLMLLIKLKAMKALLLSKLALLLSLYNWMKKKGGGGGGGGGGHGKEVIIVHDAHGGGGGGGYEHLSSNNLWATGGGGWAGGGPSNQWFNGHDSYSQSTSGSDSTYSGVDQSYQSAGQSGGWGNTAGSSSGGGYSWKRQSATDPQWVSYRAYTPENEKQSTN